MTPVRSTILGLVTGITVYFSAVLLAGPESGDIVMTPEMTPHVTPVPRGVTGDIRGVKTVAPEMALVSPTLAPVPSAPLVVTPWPSRLPSPSASPSPTPSIVVTPWPSPSSSPTPIQTPTPGPSVTPSRTPTPSPTPSVTLVPSVPPSVVINEVAWSGTASSSADEWIELFNDGPTEVDLSGWELHTADGLLIAFSTEESFIIASGSFLLIERTDDSTVATIPGDLIGPFKGSGLSNAGEHLLLIDANGVVQDEVDCLEGWFAGTASSGDVPYASMERSPDGSWHTGGAIQVGSDVGGNPINGTPRFPNSTP